MDEEFVIVNTKDTSVVSTENRSIALMELTDREVVSDLDESYVTLTETDVVVLSAGAQGPQGPAGVGAAQELELEAGENLLIGTPVKVVANKVYAASYLTDPLVIGIIKASVISGEVATVVVGGSISLSGLSPNTPYFLGDEAISTTPPSSGYVTRLGSAVSASTLLVNIEEPILLS